MNELYDFPPKSENNNELRQTMTRKKEQYFCSDMNWRLKTYICINNLESIHQNLNNV